MIPPEFDRPYPLFSINQPVQWTVRYPILTSAWDVVPEETEEAVEAGTGYILEQRWANEPWAVGREPHWVYLVQEVDELGELAETSWYDEDQLEPLKPPAQASRDRSISLEIMPSPEPSAIVLDLACPLPISQLHLFDEELNQQHLVEWYLNTANHPFGN